MNNYTSNVSLTLNSIININNIQDTSINGILATLPSYLQSASANLIYAPIANPTFTGTISGITKSMVGLSNVDNTSDANKPVSTATQTALNLKANIANPTFTGTLIAPTINATTSIQENGVDIDTKFQPLFWVWVIIPSSATNGAVAISTWAGQVSSVSCNRTATGTYVLSWTPSIGTNTYFVNGNVRNAGGFISFSGTTATGCNILTYNASGTLTDIASGCHVMILKF